MAVEYSRPYIIVIAPSLFTASLFTAHGWGLERQRREMNLPFHSLCCSCFFRLICGTNPRWIHLLYLFIYSCLFSLFFCCNTSNGWFHTCMLRVRWLNSSTWIVPLPTRGGDQLPHFHIASASLWISESSSVSVINITHCRLQWDVFKHSWQTPGPPVLYWCAGIYSVFQTVIMTRKIALVSIVFPHVHLEACVAQI